MKNLIFLVLGLLIFHSTSIGMSRTKNTPPSYDQMWKEVTSFEQKGHYQSALDKVEEIYELALEDDNDPQLVKTFVHRTQLMSQLEEDGWRTAIIRAEEVLKGSKPSVKAILFSLLAEQYAQYYQRHRWEVDSRHHVQDEKSNDVSTWSSQQFNEVILSYYLNSLTHHPHREMPISHFEAVVKKGKEGEEQLPFVYDVLLHRALVHLQNGVHQWSSHSSDWESSYQKKMEAFTLERIDQLKSAKWELSAQRLNLKFHTQWKPVYDREFDVSSFLEAQMEEYKNSEFYPEVALTYVQFINPGPQSDMSYAEAHSLLKGAIDRFPNAWGVKNIRSYLHNTIEAKSLHLQAEFAVPVKEYSKVLLRYRNIGSVYMHWAKVKPGTSFQNDYRDRQGKLNFYNFTFDDPEKIDLPRVEDFNEHKVEIKIDPMEAGEYLVVFSEKEKLDYDQFGVFTFLRSSDLMATWYEPQVVVLNRNSGKSISGVEVTTYQRNYDQDSRKSVMREVNRWTTDQSGKVRIPLPSRESMVLRLKKGEDVLYLDDQRIYAHGEPLFENRYRNEGTIFTDRSIYRPGQLVEFRLLAQESSGKEKVFLPHRNVEIGLYDVNGQEVSQLKIKTNHLGSAYGSFKLPETILPGTFQIRCLGEIKGQQSVRVEAYKRPQIELTFLKDTSARKLSDVVTQSVEARTYFGASIPNADVQYRVSQVLITPYFMTGGLFRGCYFPWRTTEIEVKSGKTVTGEDGVANISFQSEVPKESFKGIKPWVRYKVEASLIDGTGERADAVKTMALSTANYTLSGPPELEWSIGDSMAYQIRATNYEQELAMADVVIQLDQMRAPQVNFLKRRLWDQPDAFIYDEESFKTWFPNEAYADEFQLNAWSSETLSKTQVQFKGDYRLNLDDQISQPGLYKLRIYSKEGEVIHQSLLKVYDEADKHLPIGYDGLKFIYDTLREGENEIKILTSNGIESVLIADHGKRVLQASSEFNLLLRREDQNRAGFAWLTCLGNRVQNETIMLPYVKDQTLNIEWVKGEVDEVLPGDSIHWVWKITDEKGDPVESEVFLTVYDQALEVYQPHQWSTHALQWPGGYIKSFNPLGMGAAQAQIFHNHQPYLSGVALVYPDFINATGYYRYDHILMQRSNEGVPPMVEMDDLAKSEGVQIEEAADNQSAIESTAEDNPPRTNLTESPFFAQSLSSDKDGLVHIQYTASESLSAWNVLALAYDQHHKFVELKTEYRTFKPLLIQPFTSRFYRSGDKAQISCRVVNQMDQDVLVTVSLNIQNPIDQSDLSSWLTDGTGETFLLEAGQTSIKHFSLQVPENFEGVIQYTAQVKGGTLSDGEINYLPVLSQKKRVTETYSFFLESGQKESKSLSEIGFHISDQQENPRLVLESVPQPLWFVFKTLPYISEKQNESITQLVNAYLVNRLGAHSLETYPWLGRVIQGMKDESPLQRNEELNDLLLKYTPYLNDAANEAENYGLIRKFYNPSALQANFVERKQALLNRQLSNGGFSWVPGGRDSWYVTQYVLDAWTELHVALGEDINDQWFKSALAYAENAFEEYRQKLQRKDDHTIIVSDLAIRFLWVKTRLKMPFSASEREVWSLIKKNWVKYRIYNQAVIGYMLSLNEDDAHLLSDIIQSFEERKIDGGDRGISWKYDQGMRWTERAVYVHSFIMRWYDHMNKREELDKMIQWLIQQKRTQSWESKVSSVSAILAILKASDGKDHSEVKQLLVQWNNENPFVDKKADQGFIRYETDQAIRAQANIEVDNPNGHPAWLNVFHQYTDDFDQIKASQSDILSIDRKWYVRSTPSRINPLKKDQLLKKGDVVVVRLHIKVDRDMEYVLIRDGRPASMEPGVSTSGYRWEGGLGYYQATLDQENQFFIDYLPRGEHIIEYELQVTHAGQYASGLPQIQCMYAPEFSAHGAGSRVQVR